MLKQKQGQFWNLHWIPNKTDFEFVRNLVQIPKLSLFFFSSIDSFWLLFFWRFKNFKSTVISIVFGHKKFIKKHIKYLTSLQNTFNRESALCLI